MSTPTKYLTVDANDLKILCEAVLDNIWDCDSGGSWGSQRDYCRFCRGPAEIDRVGCPISYTHELNCTVLIAESVKPRE